MGNPSSKLYKNVPFPVNAGPTQVERKIERTKPAHGPSKMPHVETPKAIAPRDAMGRTVVEDGTARLRSHWPATSAGVIGTPMAADFMLGIMLHSTTNLNTFIKKNKMLAFCIIDTHKAVMLYDIPYKKACEKNPDKPHTMQGAAEALPASEHRLSEAQLQEVVARLVHAYRDYGIGAMCMCEDRWVYQVMVPNSKDYLLHKVFYDCHQAAVAAVVEERHAGSKRTRSGKVFGVRASE